VIWKEKRLTSGKKGSWAQATGSHGETAGECEKGIVGSQTAGETRAQSPKSKWGNGGDPWSKNTEKK